SARVFLPALPEPRPDRALDPDLWIIQEPFQESERFVQLAREYEVPQGIHRDPTTPGICGFRPAQNFLEAPRLAIYDLRDQAHSEPIAQAPAGRLVCPAVEQRPGVLVQDLQTGVEQVDCHGLLLERRAVPQGCRERVERLSVDILVRLLETGDDFPQVGDGDAEDRDR